MILDNNDKKLEKLLKELGNEAQPGAKFQKSLHKQLKTRFKEVHGRQGWSFSFIRFKLQFGAIMTVLALTTSTIYAYNNDAIVPGNILYPLKRSAEKVEEIFAGSGEDKSNFYSKMAERRTRELNYLDIESQTYKETLRESEQLVNLAKAEIINIKKTRAPEINNPFVRPVIRFEAVMNKMPENKEIKTTSKAKPEIIVEPVKKNTETGKIQSEIPAKNETAAESGNKVETEANIGEAIPATNQPSNQPVTSANKINIPVTSAAKPKKDKIISPIQKRIEKVEMEIEKLKIDRETILKSKVQIILPPKTLIETTQKNL